MKKSDLKSGMLIEMRGVVGVYFVCGNVIMSNDNWFRFSDFDDNLNSTDQSFDNDVLRVSRVVQPQYLIDVNRNLDALKKFCIWNRNEFQKGDTVIKETTGLQVMVTSVPDDNISNTFSGVVLCTGSETIGHESVGHYSDNWGLQYFKLNYKNR